MTIYERRVFCLTIPIDEVKTAIIKSRNLQYSEFKASARNKNGNSRSGFVLFVYSSFRKREKKNKGRTKLVANLELNEATFCF